MDEQQCLEGLEDDRTIFRHPKDREHPYVMVAKATALDNRNSGIEWMAAQHLLTVMLCMPDDWDFNLRHLAQTCRVGKNVAARLVALLIEAGYVVRDQSRRRGGRFGPGKYLIFENPTVSPLTGHGQPGPGPRDTVSRAPVAPCTVKRDILSTPDLETEYREREEAPPSAPPQEPEQDLGGEVVATMTADYQDRRGRRLTLSKQDVACVGEIAKSYGVEAVARAFRRFLARAPPGKEPHWFVQDWEQNWKPRERPAPRVIRRSPPEEDGPPASPQDVAELMAGLGGAGR